VAFVAAISHEKLLPVLGISYRRGVGLPRSRLLQTSRWLRTKYCERDQKEQRRRAKCDHQAP
jgi:hypothetical protein